MIKSWWQLGEGIGKSGDTLAVYEIECPFCEERGNFSTVYETVKRKPNGRKELHFDTLKCGNCGGFVMVLWSAAEFGGLHDYRVLPSPISKPSAPSYWPPEVQRFYIQALDSLNNENWDAATVMARSALQVTLRHQGAKGKRLIEEIDDLAARGILPPIMKDWSNELRDLANDSAHPKLDSSPTKPGDAADIVEFLEFLLTYLYNMPKQINDYRERKKASQ